MGKIEAVQPTRHVYVCEQQADFAIEVLRSLKCVASVTGLDAVEAILCKHRLEEGAHLRFVINDKYGLHMSTTRPIHFWLGDDLKRPKVAVIGPFRGDISATVGDGPPKELGGMVLGVAVLPFRGKRCDGIRISFIAGVRHGRGRDTGLP